MNSREIRILTTVGVDKLRRLVQQGVLSNYLEEQFPLEKVAPEFFPGSTLQLNSVPELIVTEGSRTARAGEDAENAIKLYESLRLNNEAEAADERLWVSLTHTVFHDYVRRRWPLVQETNVQHVLEHWFLGKGTAEQASRPLRRNAISRLWWAAHLTVAPWARTEGLEKYECADPYKYTKILLSKQDFFQHLLERNFGHDQRLLICVLHALGEQTLPRAKATVQQLGKDLNRKLANREISHFPTDDLQSFVNAAVQRAALL